MTVVQPVSPVADVPIATAGRLATITVSYCPELALLERQMQLLPVDALKVVVDNASPPPLLAGLRAMLERIPGAVLLANAANVGLAAALDQGVRYVADFAPRCEYVLLLDQDSEPDSGSLPRLLEAFSELQTRGLKPGAVGPQLRDADNGLHHGFHQMTAWRWQRAHPPVTLRDPVPVASLNGSGTLMPLQIYTEAGGLDHALFIDHVDTEWSFRLLALGYTLWGVPDAIFTHRMGERGQRFWLAGWRVWPQRAPLRHRYLFRNTLWLMSRSYVPRVWKVWAVVKLALTALVYGLTDPQRGEQLAAMWRGLGEGLRARKG